jgi:uncharacterized protein YjbI with pentapeptide repeats
VDIQGALFEHLKLLTKCRLDGKDISGWDLTGIDVTHTSFVNCVMNRVLLDAAKINFCNFSHAKMQKVFMRKLLPTMATVPRLNFNYADLTEADLSDSSFWGGGDFSQANFTRSVCERVQFNNCSMDRSRFLSADLEIAFFGSSTLTEASFARARFRNGLVKDSKLRGAVFAEADCSGTKFTNCDLENADFTNANLGTCTFTGSILKGAKIDYKWRNIVNGYQASSGAPAWLNSPQNKTSPKKGK